MLDNIEYEKKIHMITTKKLILSWDPKLLYTDIEPIYYILDLKCLLQIHC